MATRIIGIPDKHGIIRIRCGSDNLEILVIDSRALAAKGIASLLEPAEPNPDTPPGDPEHEREGTDTEIDPWKEIHTFLGISGTEPLEDIYTVPKAKYSVKPEFYDIGPGSVTRIVEELGKQRIALDQPNPNALYLKGQRQLDVHTISRLSREADLPIFIDFKGL